MDPVSAARHFFNDFVALRKEEFCEALTEDVSFNFDAEIITPGKEPFQHKGGIKNKDQVIAVLAQRHFSIVVEPIHLEKEIYEELPDGRVKCDFISIETKKEPHVDGEILVKYRYNGHFSVSFAKSEDGSLKVNNIFLVNTRQNI